MRRWVGCLEVGSCCASCCVHPSFVAKWLLLQACGYCSTSWSPCWSNLNTSQLGPSCFEEWWLTLQSCCTEVEGVGQADRTVVESCVIAVFTTSTHSCWSCLTAVCGSPSFEKSCGCLFSKVAAVNAIQSDANHSLFDARQLSSKLFHLHLLAALALSFNFAERT